MKECKYCGTIYADNLSACPSCGGTRTVTDEERIEETDFKRKETENRERAVAAPQKQRNVIIGAVAAIVVVAIAIVVAVSISANSPLSNGMSKKEGEQILADGIAYYDAGNYEAAMKCFAQLPSDSKQYEEAQSMLNKSTEIYRTGIMERVNDYLHNEEYNSAIELIKSAQILLPNDMELQNTFSEAYRKSVLNKADYYINQGQVTDAIALLETAQNTLPSDVELQNKYATVYAGYKQGIVSDALIEAENYALAGEYDKAILAISVAQEKVGQDDELLAKHSVYEKIFIDRTIEKASQTYIPYNADSIFSAEDIISSALSVLPDSSDLKSELVSYQEREPIKIIEMPATDAEYFYTSGTFSAIDTVEDCNGHEQVDAAKVEQFAFDATDDDHKWWWYCYKSIDLDFQYSKITGTLFQNPKYSGASTTTKMEICGYKEESYYHDTVLKAVSINGQSNQIVNFEVDVSGRKYIRLTFMGDHAAGSEDKPYEYAYISKLYLWK